MAACLTAEMSIRVQMARWLTAGTAIRAQRAGWLTAGTAIRARMAARARGCCDLPSGRYRVKEVGGGGPLRNHQDMPRRGVEWRADEREALFGFCSGRRSGARIRQPPVSVAGAAP